MPDRASLIEILRLCSHDRFQEAYAFLQPGLTDFENELSVMLGANTQKFEAGDKERLLQVWNHAKYMHKANRETTRLMILEFPFLSYLDRVAGFREILNNARNVGLTLIVIEQHIQMSFGLWADTAVANKRQTTVEQETAWRTFFLCYDKPTTFAAAYALERAHGSRLVYVANGVYNDVEGTVRSLAVDNIAINRDVFTFQLPTRFVNNMDKTEHDRYMSALLTGQDAFVTQEMALQLFHTTTLSPEEFAASRHAKAITTYAAWLAHLQVELLAITDTSCGHLPRVLCKLIEAYV